MDKPKVLWVGDAVAKTGFARVNHSLIEHLKDKYEIHLLGINYRGDPHEFDYSIYPAIIGGDVWGFGRFESLINFVKPDLIFTLNDPWVIDKYLNILREKKISNIPVVVYFPVDAEEHNPGWYAYWNDYVAQTAVYTEFAKDVIRTTGMIDEASISVIPHGSDLETFFSILDYKDKKGHVLKTGEQISREAIYPYKTHPEFEDALIFLNANRNQPRKRMDITLRAFGAFAKDKGSDVRLYMHMGTRDMGWDVKGIASRYGFDDKLILSSDTSSIPSVPDDRLNLIYNATTVGINTAMGEGWGLTNWEHGGIGRMQVVPDHSACREIWKGNGLLIPCSESYIYPETGTLAKVPSEKGLMDIFEEIYDDYKNNDSSMIKDYGKRAKKLVSDPKYNWKNIAKQFDELFQKALNNK